MMIIRHKTPTYKSIKLNEIKQLVKCYKQQNNIKNEVEMMIQIRLNFMVI